MRVFLRGIILICGDRCDLDQNLRLLLDPGETRKDCEISKNIDAKFKRFPLGCDIVRGTYQIGHLQSGILNSARSRKKASARVLAFALALRLS